MLKTIAGVNAGTGPAARRRRRADHQPRRRRSPAGLPRRRRHRGHHHVLRHQQRRRDRPHFRTIHASVDVPVFVYDVPVRTHFKLPTDLLLELGREGVIAGVKDSSGDDVSFRQLLMAPRTSRTSTSSPATKWLLTAPCSAAHRVLCRAWATLTRAATAACRPLRCRRLGQAAAEQDRLADVFNIVYTPKPAASPATPQAWAPSRPPWCSWASSRSNVMSTPMLALDEDETAAIKVILERNGLV